LHEPTGPGREGGRAGGVVEGEVEAPGEGGEGEVFAAIEGPYVGCPIGMGEATAEGEEAAGELLEVGGWEEGGGGRGEGGGGQGEGKRTEGPKGEREDEEHS